MPVVWGTSLLGMPIHERVAGADLVPLLVEDRSVRGWRIHVFGSSPRHADPRRPSSPSAIPVRPVSIDPGPIIPTRRIVDDEVLDGITAVDADILCVALGNPKQERFIHAHRERLGVPVMIGVGGSLDLLVGGRASPRARLDAANRARVDRPPRQEPRRLGGRYAHDIRVFGPRLAREWRQVRPRRTDPASRSRSRSTRSTCGSTGRPTRGPSSWGSSGRSARRRSALQLRRGSASTIHDHALTMLIGLSRSPAAPMPRCDGSTTRRPSPARFAAGASRPI